MVIPTIEEYILTPSPIMRHINFDYPQDIVLWETSEDGCLFFDDLPYWIFENTEPDDRGFYFFDAELFPVLTYQQYVKTRGICQSLWPMLEYINENSQLSFLLPISIRSQRRARFWSSYFFTLLQFFHRVFDYVFALYFVCFTLTGMGFSCDLINNHQLRLIVSNTHDIILTPTAQVVFGCRTINIDNKSFVCFGSDFRLLRQCAHRVRQLISFNPYEYQGLLYTREQKQKKITKQKQK